MVALALVALLLFATLLELPGGPIDQSGGGVGRSRLKVGDVETFQFFSIQNPTGHTIRLTKVEPRQVDPGLEVLGFRIAPHQLDRPVAESGWPPPRSEGEVFDVDGFALPSRGTGVVSFPVLIVGVRFTQPGRHRISGFRLHYRDHLPRRVSTADGWLELSGR